MEDFYNTLGLAPSSSHREIKEAYRKLSKRLHPDVDPGNLELEERFKALQVAYSALKDPVKKKDYDKWLEAHKGRMEQAKTYANPVPSKATPNSKKAALELFLLLKRGIKKKDGYRIGLAILILFMVFSLIIFLENKFYNEAPYLEPRNESIQTVPLLDSMEFIKGFNDSVAIKERIEASSIKKN